MQVLYLYWLVAGLFISEYVQLISDRGSFIKSAIGRSLCDYCSKEIPWYVLIPIIGRFFVKEQCPYCHHKIARKYLLFEVIFGLYWALALWLYSINVMYSHIGVAALLFAVSCSWLLIYEDLRHFSVPLPWFVTWIVSYVGVWYVLGNRQLYWLDALLAVVSIGLSLFTVSLSKRQEQVDIGSMFGIADTLALIVIALLLGFSQTTVVLVGALILSIGYLVIGKRLKIGQKIPFLTMLLPWSTLLLLFF